MLWRKVTHLLHSLRRNTPYTNWDTNVDPLSIDIYEPMVITFPTTVVTRKTTHSFLTNFQADLLNSEESANAEQCVYWSIWSRSSPTRRFGWVCLLCFGGNQLGNWGLRGVWWCVLMRDSAVQMHLTSEHELHAHGRGYRVIWSQNKAHVVAHRRGYQQAVHLILLLLELVLCAMLDPAVDSIKKWTKCKVSVRGVICAR